MVELQGHWGERFGGTFLDDLSLRRACRATGESVLEVYFWMAFGRARPKLYHHYGRQGRRSWPQDGSNAAVRQPTWRLDGCTCPQPGAWMATSISLTSAVRARCGRLSTRSVLNKCCRTPKRSNLKKCTPKKTSE